MLWDDFNGTHNNRQSGPILRYLKWIVGMRLACVYSFNAMFMKNVGSKRGFGDLEDDEDDFFSSKKVFLPYINLIF